MSTVCAFCDGLWHIVTTGLFYGTAQWASGNIFLSGCGRGQGRAGIHMGLDLVMKEGCEWMGNKLVTLSHTEDGDRKWITDTRMSMMTDSEGTLDRHGAHEHVLCCLEKTAGGCFRCPTQTVKDKTVWSDVITTAYANQLCDLMGCTGFKFSVRSSTAVCVCVHLCKYLCTCLFLLLPLNLMIVFLFK